VEICDYKTLVTLLGECPDEACIITCDAELAKSMTPLRTMWVMYSWLALAHKSHAQYGLFKIFCESDEHMVHVLVRIYTIYNSVKIITPHFSSYEGYEVYLLASDFSPKTITQILSNYQNNVLVRSLGAYEYSTSLKHLRQSRVSDRPFQEKLGDDIKQYWENTLSLNFADNGIHIIEKLTLHVRVYDLSPISNWVRSTRTITLKRATRCLGVQSITYYGIEQDIVPATYFPKQYKLSTQMERYPICAINCDILLHVIQNMSNWN
jgi:hypothetical protein